MRFTFLFVSSLCLMLVSACGDDTKAPTPDQKVVADQKVTPTPDKKVATPDQPTPDQKATPDTMPHFDGTVAKCPNEVNLTNKLPCMCGSTLVYDLAIQYPACTSPQVVKCCPAEGKPKCE
jgi:hypothetical protein